VKHRLCLPEQLGSADVKPGRRLPLDASHAHYLGRVLRLRRGAEVALFDGRGREWSATVTDIAAKVAEVEINAASRQDPEPTRLILAQSWLKGAAMDTVVQKSVELGATAIWLFDAARSNVKVDANRRAGRVGHLTRVVVSAAEQCEALWLPSLTTFADLAAVLAQDRPGRTLFLDPGAAPLNAGSAPEPLTLLVGPEGGWSDAERSEARADPTVTHVGLGTLILRAETAPLAALAAIRQAWAWRR
jgi:16S rRNA (uracil1498-N3)-methyltransferase